ncbi:3-hydroxyacyl-[acyl-carrier-protein] dehydratase FabZ [Rosistilla oblonga]|uniref:3-hydroxyacyl-[acyl-carrier-protein] dehydratase FabZ n=1 Tax=Rosistilla ulvae TaxID=1930277 RepID=A0A517M8Q1_9BACT|nr:MULTISPECIES: 3-hydroxyacyl-ACP dehydratase FabZ family protein [Rosistilla]QDS91262.1 3-hydroxyacyl-[acyl-carrier-protein] dehydratase FabZ [Rosistilla ulvae]QDV15377.1 3-hydroxyacyl-[acyl-carrier-protein] dehydratase FabZ [Rosistilla oblonga]
MRWFWIDRFTYFKSRERAEAIKNISLTEEPVDEYLPAHPVFPNTLIIEGLAQTGGILVSECFDFQQRIVLAKVGKAKFHQPARPGDTLHYTATIDDLQNDGAVITGTSYCEGKLQAEVQMLFAFLDEERFGTGQLFNPANLLTMLRLMRLWEVAQDADGNPLPVSKNLLDDESTPAT